MTQHIHDKLVRLLVTEDATVRTFLTRAIELAQTRRVPAENLVAPLQRELDRVLKEDADADTEA